MVELHNIYILIKVRWVKVVSSVFLYLFLEVFSDFVEVGGLDLEGIFGALYFGYDAGHLIYFLDPLINVRLVLINIVFNHRNVIDDFLGILRHYLDLSDQLALLLHVHLFQLQDQLILVLSQLLVGCALQFFGDLDEVGYFSVFWVLLLGYFACGF